MKCTRGNVGWQCTLEATDALRHKGVSYPVCLPHKLAAEHGDPIEFVGEREIKAFAAGTFKRTPNRVPPASEVRNAPDELPFSKPESES